MIINKEKISNGECPEVDDDMRDIDIEEEEDDRCGDCPYCDSRVSITWSNVNRQLFNLLLP